MRAQNIQVLRVASQPFPGQIPAVLADDAFPSRGGILLFLFGPCWNYHGDYTGELAYP